MPTPSPTPGARGPRSPARTTPSRAVSTTARTSSSWATCRPTTRTTPAPRRPTTTPTPTSSAPTTRAPSASGNGIYDAINRVNIILDRVPAVTDLDDTEKNEILGEAHFLRALHYHNLVKLYGDVPIRLTPVKDVNEAGGRRPEPGGRCVRPDPGRPGRGGHPHHRDRADHAGHPGRRGRADAHGCSCTGRTTPRRWRPPTW